MSSKGFKQWLEAERAKTTMSLRSGLAEPYLGYEAEDYCNIRATLILLDEYERSKQDERRAARRNKRKAG